MKDRDWKGYKLPIHVECFSPVCGLGVEFKIRAAWKDEAEEKTRDIVERQHHRFFERSGGHYQTKFSRIVT